MMEKSFSDLLASLSGEYGGYREKYKSALDENQSAAMRAMLGRFMAYGTADSEQREQAEERMNKSYAQKYGDYLDSLARQEAGARSTIGNQQAKALAAIMEGESSDAYNMLLNKQGLRQQAFENQLRSLAASRGGERRPGMDEQAKSLAGDFGRQWVSNQPSPYSRGGGREAGSDYLARMLGGSPGEYESYFPDGWEDWYWSAGKPSAPSIEQQIIAGWQQAQGGGGVMVDEYGRKFIEDNQ